MSMNMNDSDDLDDIVNACIHAVDVWCQTIWFYSIIYGLAKHDFNVWIYFSNVCKIVSNLFSCKFVFSIKTTQNF